jgi:hypothetical protein
MAIPNMNFPRDTSLSCLCSQTPPIIAEAQIVEKQADTFLHAREIIRCANALKPFPRSGAHALHHNNEPRAKVYYLFILVIAEPGQCVISATDAHERYTSNPGDFRAMPSKASSNFSRHA